MAEEIHRVSSSTSPAVSPPSMMLRTVSLAPPTFQPIWSSSFKTTGNRPLTHSTMASHATQEMVCSSSRAQRACAKATCSTFTPTRITSSANRTGTATLNTASDTYRASTHGAT